MEVHRKAIELGDQYGSHAVLLVFDVDNTLLAANQGLGSDQWYDWQKDSIEGGAADRVTDHIEELYQIVAMLHNLGSMHPPQNDMPVVVQDLQERGFPAMVLTARSPELRVATERELKSNNYNFGHCPPPVFHKQCVTRFRYFPYLSRNEIERLKLKKPRDATFGDGLLMAAGQHKGAMLKIVINEAANFGHVYKAVVFVDDKSENTNAVWEALEGMGLSLFTYEYTRAGQTALDKSKASTD